MNVPADGSAKRGVQVRLAPGTRRPDFSSLVQSTGAIDMASIADLLRNAFVYPPHSIYEDVKVAITAGFDDASDLHGEVRFRFPYLALAAVVSDVDDAALVARYHALLAEAAATSTARMASPWLLQSGGKDSTSMAIALAEARPDATCITYRGGSEEDELDSARFVARHLGLRHECLVCDAPRAYDRYLAMVPRMPLLTADFALLSYADLVAHVGSNSGDGIVDATGSDSYFGMHAHLRHRMLALLARGMRVPRGLADWQPLTQWFRLSYALGTLQMNAFERLFPGSRFSDGEVDGLLGTPGPVLASRHRLELFRPEIAAATRLATRRGLAATIVEAASFGKGMFVTAATGMDVAYPYCDPAISGFVLREVPPAWRMGPNGQNKRLVRAHIARYFERLPYVRAKGCFRFDVRQLAHARFDQVHAFSVACADVVPGATAWLEGHRRRLDNKYHASKFYLLAVVLPWVYSRLHPADR
ncbi:asparagine synthase-related protein [Luteibacter sp. NPDC031894]|uniref:asparagine synthase-related protein n=1 Tax=Luteibacter sp. NPDC031894 TaxID=3390572 RepID=UPI003D080C1A